MDPREQRTSRLLRDTLFDLARTRDIATITATELSRETGLARRTIYNHGASPQALLFGYLTEELTEIRDSGAREFKDRTPAKAFEEGLHRLLDHVQRHRAIYTRALSATTSPAWHHLLTQHFTVSLTVYIDEFLVRVPAKGRMSGLAFDADTESVVASSIAHSMAGSIEAWLRLDDEPDVDLCYRLILALTPTWFLGEDIAH